MLIITTNPNSRITPILAVRKDMKPTMVVKDAMSIVGKISFVEVKTKSLFSVKLAQ